MIVGHVNIIGLANILQGDDHSKLFYVDGELFPEGQSTGSRNEVFKKITLLRANARYIHRNSTILFTILSSDENELYRVECCGGGKQCCLISLISARYGVSLESA